MQWSDSANVCGTKSEESKTQAASEAPLEALTDGTASQPLTRIDCHKASMVWNESANVCGEKSEGKEAGASAKIEAGPQTLSTAASNKPLTRSDCAKAGMTRNKRGNVCGAKTEGMKGQAASVAAPKAESTSKAGSAKPKTAKSPKIEAGPQTLSTAASNKPLTRSDCDKAGMAWNKRGNVCGAKTEGTKGQAASVAAPKAESTSKAGSAKPKTAKAAKSQAHTKRKYTHRHIAQPEQTFERPFWPLGHNHKYRKMHENAS